MTVLLEAIGVSRDFTVGGGLAGKRVLRAVSASTSPSSRATCWASSANPAAASRPSAA